MSIHDQIQKPTLVVNELAARRNIRRMAAKAEKSGLTFRPHFKTHQSAEIGQWFRDEGVEVITVSSVDMAEYFADANWKDITIAFSVNIRQMDAYRDLTRRIRLGLLVEDESVVEQLNARLDVPVDLWIKIDTGSHRTGIDCQDTDKVLRVARKISLGRHRLKGILTHSSQTYALNDPVKIQQTFRNSVKAMLKVKGELKANGMQDILVSMGDTPGCILVEDFSGVDEIRPGNFVFYDLKQFTSNVCAFEDVAVAVACPVVAIHEERSQVVVFGGAVHLSKEYLELDGIRNYGWVSLPEKDGWSRPMDGAYVERITQEHGVVQMSAVQLQNIRVGDLLYIIPVHSCLTIDLFDVYLNMDGRKHLIKK